MQTLITGYPNLEAVFVQNEDMALGAIMALEEAGKQDQVAIVSQNGAPYGLESIAQAAPWEHTMESMRGTLQLNVEELRHEFAVEQGC